MLRPPPSPFNPSPPVGKRMMTSTLPNQSPVQSPMDDNDAYDSKFFDLLQKFSTDRPKQSAYEEALGGVPNRADYAPSIGRRIAAGIAGAGAGLSGGAAEGIAAGEHIAESPYRNAMSDYATRLAASERAAEMEDKQIGQTLQNVGTAAQYGSANRTYRAGQYWKEKESQYKEDELDIKDFEAVTGRQRSQTEFQNIQSQIERRIAQSNNENEIARLMRIRDSNTAAYQGRMAGAAEGRTEAAKIAAERAGGAGPLYQPEAQNDARNLALRTLKERGGALANMIEVNRGEYGETYNVKQGAEDYVNEQLGPVLADIERRMRGGRGANRNQRGQPLLDQGQDPSDNPFEVQLDLPR